MRYVSELSDSCLETLHVREQERQQSVSAVSQQDRRGYCSFVC